MDWKNQDLKEGDVFVDGDVEYKLISKYIDDDGNVVGVLFTDDIE